MLNSIITIISLIVVIILFIFAQNFFISKVPKKGKSKSRLTISLTENSYIEFESEYEDSKKQKLINNK